MKRLIIVIAASVFALTSCAQNEITQKNVFRLFPTENYWTFIKLNTRNGQMWQVQFSVSEPKENFEVILNSLSLVSYEGESNGRFTLYPTKNMFTFLLLDQVNGDVYQTQWSREEEYRGIIRKIKSKE